MNNGCKYLNLSYSKLEGSLDILEESKLRYLDLTLCEANEEIFTNLLYSCQYLEKLSLAYLNIIPTMIQTICYQNEKSLQILGLGQFHLLYFYFSNSSPDSNSVPDPPWFLEIF